MIHLKFSYLEGRLFFQNVEILFGGNVRMFFHWELWTSKKTPAAVIVEVHHIFLCISSKMSRIDSSPHIVSRDVPGEKKSATRRVLKQPSKFRYDQGQIWNFAFEKCRFSPIKMKISPIEGRSKQTVNADQWSCLHVFLAEKKGDLRTEVGRWGFGPKKSVEERKFTREWGYQDVMPLQPQIAKDLFLGFRFGHLFLAPFLVRTCLSTRCLKGIWNRSETITSHTLKVFFSWKNPGK